MEKNTAWAIGLSTVVLVGWFAIQTIFFPAPKNTEVAAENAAEVVSSENAEGNNVSETAAENATVESIVKTDSENEKAEEKFFYENGNVKVEFTNRGGDIVSLELKKHLDSETGTGVEMVNNASDFNRAFSLSLGNSEKNIVNEIFEAKRISENKIGFFKTFTIKNSKNEDSKFTLVKTYTFDENDFMFKLDINVDGDEKFEGLDFDGTAYTLRTSPQIGPRYNQKDRYEVREFMSFSDGKKKRATVSPSNSKKFEKDWTWTGIGGKYFCEMILPANSSSMGNIVYSAVNENGNTNSQIKATRNSFKENKLQDTYYIYAGPRVDKELEKYKVAEKNAWNLSETHLDEGLPTSGILSPIEKLLKLVMELLYKVIPNWGVAIIILTAILKFAMFPLTKKTAMGTSKMGEVQPKIQALQAKYKDNPQKLQQEQMKVYKEIGYNPMSGCLPMIFQFVILFAMYHLFNNYFEFRGASFIPGWIGDLSQGDHVKTLSFNIPLLGNELRILPVIYVVSQLLYGKITQNGGTAATTANQGSMKFMMYGMPLMFFFLFYNAPSGLILYWTVSNAIQLGQQLYINARVKATSKKSK